MKATAARNAKGALCPPLLSCFLLSHSPAICQTTTPLSSITANQTKLSHHHHPQPPQPPLGSANGTTVPPSAQTSSFESRLLLPPPHFPVPGSTGLPRLPLSIARIPLSCLSSSVFPCTSHCARPGHQELHRGHLQKHSLWSSSLCPSLFGVSHPHRTARVTLPALSSGSAAPDLAPCGRIWSHPLLQPLPLPPICPRQGHRGQTCCLLYPGHRVSAFELLFMAWSLSNLP